MVHFYGFKGGQGRSTLLAFLATELAREGINVLAVDLDAEAPSLDLVFGLGDIPAEASIVGLRGGVELSPISVGAFRGGGQVALIGFRPSAEEYDLDATALAFEASVNAPSHERLATALRDGVGNKFGVILIDHRTGLGPTVPAWVRTMPGPIVVMDRLDGQCRRAVRDVRRIWAGLPNPGVLVSYVPPSMSPESLREHKRGEAWSWLEVLALAKSERAEEPLGAEDVEDHWILWPDDNAFRRGALPQHDDVGGLTSEAIRRPCGRESNRACSDDGDAGVLVDRAGHSSRGYGFRAAFVALDRALTCSKSVGPPVSSRRFTPCDHGGAEDRH